jgi:tetratricopeptide (TPR) repeat protein
MSLHLMIGLIGLLYILAFGGIGLLRREGLSIRFAIESVIITGIAVILVVLLSVQVHPVIFLLVLYLITMRIRILVDLANSFAKRGSSAQAEKIYRLASRLWPDQTNELIIKVNHATMMLQNNHYDEAIAMFTDILSQVDKGYLGVKYEAAAHFNLGVAHLRKNNTSMAVIEFNSTIDSWPGSLYAHRAEQALNRQHQKEPSAVEDEPDDP